QPVYQFDLDIERDDKALFLQASARPDFNDLYVFRQPHPCSSSTANVRSSAPSLTTAPMLKLTHATTPSRGAVMVCSIFMASMIISGVPFAMCAPGSTSTATILPGIGAVRRPPESS